MSTRYNLLHCFFLLCLAALLSACGQEETQYQPQFGEKSATQKEEYSFGVHPLHNPQQLQAIYGPLIDFLNAKIPQVAFRLEASRDYAAYEEKLYAGKFHFALPNSYQTILAEDKGYKIFAKMGDDHNFRGVILVRKDGQIKTFADLKGKKISYPAPTALAATMLPQYLFHINGIDIKKDIENLYVGSQESSIMNVYLKGVAAGATWPLPWSNFQKEKPDIAKELEVKWETSSLPNNGILAHPSVPASIVEAVAKELLTLHTHAEGQAILARMPLSQFEKADSQIYHKVRDFIKLFTKEVRPITTE